MVKKHKELNIDTQSQGNEGELLNVEKIKPKNTEKIKSKNGNRKIILIVIGVTLLLLIGFRLFQFFSDNSTLEASKINVKVGPVQFGSISATSPVTGRIEPVMEVSIIPMASGEVTAVNVKIGDQVSNGTVLFEIDKAQLAASYSQASASYSFAEISYERMSILYKEGAVSLSDYQQSKVQYEAALAAYTMAETAYSNTSVKSPINGFVTSMNISLGSMASPGAPAASVADVSSLVINTTISEYLIGQVNVNDSVEILISTLGEKTFKGIVTSISPAPAKGTLTYPVKISIKDDTGAVKAGMFAEIRIVSAQREKVLFIPSDSVIVKNGKSLVVIIDNNMPIYREVSTGLDNGTQVEIVKGLKKDEVIVIEGQQYITEGVEVNITK